MKQCFLLMVFCLMCFIALPQRTLRVLTYNIHHGYDEKEQPELDSVASVIKQCSADIVGLEEVDSVCDRSAHIDQPAYLGHKLGMNAIFVRHFPYQNGSYGLCFLSKYAVANVRNIRLPVIIRGDTSFVALLEADVKLTHRRGLMKVIVAHFDYRSAASRINQAHFIINYCEHINSPILLMGDFNALPGTEEINIIKGSFHDVSEGESYLTYPDDHPQKKIDYVFFRPESAWKVKKTAVPNTHASDHLPLLAVLDYSIQKTK